MNPLQTRTTALGLQALASYGFALAGGYALQAHGFGDRDSDDVDLFTDDLDPANFAEAVSRLVAAYETAGVQVEIARRAPVFARLVVDSATKVDLGVDHRQQPPVTMAIGAVLSEADAIGSKVGAVYSRLEPRDFIDVQYVLDSGRYDETALLELADLREATPLDRAMFASQLRRAPASRTPASPGTAQRPSRSHASGVRRASGPRRSSRAGWTGHLGRWADE